MGLFNFLGLGLGNKKTTPVQSLEVNSMRQQARHNRNRQAQKKMVLEGGHALRMHGQNTISRRRAKNKRANTSRKINRKINK